MADVGSDLTYGEIEPLQLAQMHDDIYHLHSHISPQENKLFVDFGSGGGLALFTVALMLAPGRRFSRCIGTTRHILGHC
jgi:hypothetical protein